jgi:hypothetical protein
MKKKTWISVAALAGVLMTGAGAFAGYKYSSAPVVTSTYAVGIMGSARATADSNAYAGCSLFGSGTSASGYCQVVDSAGATKTCSFSSAGMVQAVASITPGSAIRLFFDASGNCTQIAIDTWSFYLPPTP